MDGAELQRQLQTVREQCSRAWMRMTPHEEFLREYCPAMPPSMGAGNAHDRHRHSRGRVGGGAVAWLAAAGLRRAFRKRGVDVLVVDTGMPSDAPVGRWTLPSQRGMHGSLGIPEADLLRRTGATFKLATEHVGWQGDGSHFLHAHGDIGTDIAGTPFYKFLVLQALNGQPNLPRTFHLPRGARGSAVSRVPWATTRP
jgi:hypothetical protein